MITIYPRDVACYTFAKEISIFLNNLIHRLGPYYLWLIIRFWEFANLPLP